MVAYHHDGYPPAGLPITDGGLRPGTGSRNCSVSLRWFLAALYVECADMESPLRQWSLAWDSNRRLSDLRPSARPHHRIRRTRRQRRTPQRCLGALALALHSMDSAGDGG